MLNSVFGAEPSRPCDQPTYRAARFTPAKITKSAKVQKIELKVWTPLIPRSSYLSE